MKLGRCTFLLALLAAAPLIGAESAPNAAITKLCDPFIGTKGNGHTFPGAVVPFGMVQLSPDTQIRHFKESYPWAAGYQYGDTTILGFSHTHFSGAGHSDLGDVLVTPIAGDVRLEPGDLEKPLSGYRSRFSHDTERAEPGYYAVTLADYDVRAELTATARVGLHRYTFPAGKPAHVLRRSALHHLRLSRQGAVVARARASGRHGHGLSRDARLGAGPAALFRHALLAPAHGPRHLQPRADARVRPEVRAVVRPRAMSTFAKAAGSSRVFDFGALAGAAVAGESRDLAGERSRTRCAISTPKRPAGTSTRSARRAATAWHQALGGAGHRGAASRCAGCSTPRSITRSWRRACSWMWTAPIAGRITRCITPTASRFIPRSRCGTRIAHCIRC